MEALDRTGARYGQMLSRKIGIAKKKIGIGISALAVIKQDLAGALRIACAEVPLKIQSTEAALRRLITARGKHLRKI